MSRLRTLPTRRLYAIVAAVCALAVTGGIAQAALSGGSGPKPAPKALDQAVVDALNAPAVDGLMARVHFTNNLLPSGSLPSGTASPLASSADGRLWLTNDGRFRVELQSEAGDAQIVSDGKQITLYDASSNTAYRVTLPADKADSQGAAHKPATLDGVRKALADLAGAWTVSGAQPTSTAGRPTYTVRIAPKDDGGLLGAAELAWDAEKGVPLRAAVYAADQTAPVLELTAQNVSFGSVPVSDVTIPTPAGAKVVDVNPGHTDAQGKPSAPVKGVDAVQKAIGFPLVAPDQLAGLPRKEVRLASFDGDQGALITYGQGLGAIVVLQHKTTSAPTKAGGDRALRLPEINIDGTTGTELATALGTIVTFSRNGVDYVVAGSVPPAAAENAARGLK